MLGVCYNTVDFVWFLREDKLSIILNMIQNAIEDMEMSQRMVKSLTGKLVDLRFLVPNSKYHLAFLMKDANQWNDDLERMVSLSDWTRADLTWWRVMLGVCTRKTKLPDPDRRPGMQALSVYPDAAGGSMDSLGRGVGMAILPYTWAYLPYGDRINSGCPAYDDKSLANKMSVWELVGPLMALVCCPDKCGGRQVVAHVDNAGSVFQYNTGWSNTCHLSNTVIRAIYLVATAINCDFWIVKTPRCSSKETEAADALSKCDFDRFMNKMPGADRLPVRVPQSLVEWMENPLPDRNLGTRLLEYGVWSGYGSI